MTGDAIDDFSGALEVWLVLASHFVSFSVSDALVGLSLA